MMIVDFHFFKKDTDGDTLSDGSDTEPTIYNVCIKNATDKK